MELVENSSLLSSINLRAYYRFNSGALTTDYQSAYTLTNNNTVGETANGKFGYGLDFGASNSNKYLSVASALGINNQTISVPFWFKKSSASDNVEFFMLSDATTNTQLYGYSTSGTNISVQRYRTGVAYETITVTKTMDTGWHHFCVTMENGGAGGTMTLYYDGVSIGTVAVAGTSGTVPQGDNFWIGRGPGSHYMQGNIDDLAVFNKVLSSTEVGELYTDTGNFLAFL